MRNTAEIPKIYYPDQNASVDDAIARHLVDGSRVIVSTHHRETLQSKLEALRRDGKRALVLDFDGTVTVNGNPVEALRRRRRGDHPRNQASVWQEIRFQLGFSPAAQEMMDLDVKRFAKFADIEGQLEWANRTYLVYRMERVTRQQLMRVADNIAVRGRVIDDIRAYTDSGNPVAIVSYGIADVIERVLRNNGVREGVDVYADRLQFDKDDFLVGTVPASRVVGANKDHKVQEFVSANGMENSDRITLVGDSWHDLKMLRALRDVNSSGLGIYFHHNGHRGMFNYDGLHEVSDAADLVTANLRDTSFRPAHEIIQYTVGRRIG